MRSPESLLRPELAQIEDYVPIQPFEILSARLGMPPGEIVKLDANENPYGPAPEVIEALAEYNFYHIYPDPQQVHLREAISAYAGVVSENILPTHGADEMLDLLCRLFLSPGDAIVNCPPTFGMYSFDAKLEGAKVVDIPRLASHEVDIDAVEAIFADADTQAGNLPKLIFLTSPNNPSGTWLGDDALKRMLTLPAMIVLDEAYVEFADMASRCAWVTEYDNLVVLRTFSKAAGIAGLRLGYGICPDWMMPHLWKFKQPYNVNVAATVAGLACLRHRRHMDETIAKLRTERERLFTALQQIPYLTPFQSQSNFILCDVIGGSGLAVKKALEERGILVRYYDKPGLQNCIRISVGRPDQVDRVVGALQELVGSLA